MKKNVFVYLLILCLSVAGVLSGNLFVKDVHGIPNSNVPAPDGHPHSCGIPSHLQFIDGTVTWENDSGIWANGNLTNPDSTCHQHRSNRNFGGHGDDTREPYSANKVWDNEQLRYSTNNPFDRGHGLINEWIEAGGGDQTTREPAGQSDSIPDYYFSPVNQTGDPVVWPAGAQARIREAFDMWGNIKSDRPWLATGIAFEETPNSTNAEIVIYWEPLPTVYGVFDPTASPTTLKLDSSSNWTFNADPTGIGAGQVHFLTVVLHETGHIVGFWHQNDPGELMHSALDPTTTFFQNPNQDAGCVEGVRDLYSIPAPDFGDAPDPTYPTKSPRAPPPAVDNGARNLFIGREWLGANPTGQTTTTWEWDARAVDTPDDGCVFWLPPLGVWGIGFVDVTVSVTNWQSSRYNNTFGYGLYLAIWVDWNETGWWDHPSERIIEERLFPNTWGKNTWSKRYQFNVPEGWTPTWARARLYYATTGGLFPWGLKPTFESPDNGGEVEDYYLPDEAHYLPRPVGGVWVPVDKLTLLAPYIALASTILVATAATAIYVKHAKRRKKKQ